MARRKSNVEKGLKKLAQTIEDEAAIRAEINYTAKVSRIAMIARGGLFKAPIPKARSLAPRPMPGETYRRAQARRASELRAAMKSKGMNSVLKAATKGDIPGQYSSRRTRGRVVADFTRQEFANRRAQPNKGELKNENYTGKTQESKSEMVHSPEQTFL
jgi:hypothetical protein